jgi:LacI family transcriptional regulator
MSKKEPEKKQKRPTIYDLAKLADVSPGTVSRVLNNRSNVRAVTRNRVLELAREIGLKPQATARTKEIAVVTAPQYTDRFHGYSNTLTAHAAFALTERNVGMLLPSEPLKQLNEYFMDGVIAITYGPKIYEMLCEIEKKIPVVYLDNFETGPDQYVVCSDHYNSGFKAAGCFIEHGLKRLGFISGENVPSMERLKGYTAAMDEAGLEPQKRLLALIPPNESLYTALNRLVKNKVEAIYVPGCSMQVIEALHVLTSVMGLKVPEDISLIGGENEGVSIFQSPPLTCLSEPLQQMANAAVKTVLSLAEGTQKLERKKIFPVELIERESVAWRD